MTHTVSELRQTFLDYFESKGHTIVQSGPLVPANDPTLLFTNAGMVQFKETFLGLEPRNYTRAATCQRCVRAGGKHNDLENVGYTARHHTFFEMLGNFSFGDYFKRKAIQMAWEFLTQVIKLPPEKLWVTVYEQDDEAADIWLKELKVDPARFSRCGETDNFWSMGDTGPCGPCSEIFYDHGPEIAGGPPGSPDQEGDRYIEIWNLVFMQYNRDAQGHKTPLPKPSVDTGMGLERLAAVMQNVHSNYQIDLFQSLIQSIADIIQSHSDSPPLEKKGCGDFVIADHIRASAFLIVDGVIPSNEGRGYVLRRIIRRAIRHGHQLGLREPFFYRLVSALNEKMGAAYPELTQNQAVVERILKQEEERFNETLDRGMRLLEQAIADLPDKRIPGDLIFKLYDTYGFPTDLTGDIARERDLTLDMDGFEREMEAQRTRARNAGQFEMDLSQQAQTTDCQSEFTGYEQVQDESIVTALFYQGKPINSLKAGQSGQVILEHTPFYAESGGQIGDKGQLMQGETVFEIQDTQKRGKAHVHIGQLTTGTIQLGEPLQAKIDQEARQATARNHSATHLMHAALRQTLGEHVKQKGSLVEPQRLRFDFSHFEPVTTAQLAQIEHLVNQQILRNTAVQTRIMAIEEAMNSGAMALFGEKYDAQVRVLSIGDYSTELCGGTHVQQAGDIGLFKIVSETGTAAGVRRIEALTGTRALDWVAQAEQTLNQLMTLVKTGQESLPDRIAQLLEQNRSFEKEISRLQGKLASNQGSDLASQAIEINGIKVLAAELKNMDVKQLRITLDQLKEKLGTAAILLATVKDSKISLIAGVTKNATDKIKAGDLMTHIAKQVGGKGGGRPDMAQGGGNDPSQLKGALESVTEWVRNKIS
ncbi:MAG: alanine--tRNA ligase [Candidatus Parabeggiatoa sp. nov. 3]|nr:MAG: alanine--tRNA ligase [Gammaproteobacteria bacterium]